MPVIHKIRLKSRMRVLTDAFLRPSACCRMLQELAQDCFQNIALSSHRS